MAKIYLNPGHDIYKDPGAVNKVTVLREADVNAHVGKALKTLLEQEGHQVRMMQDDSLGKVVSEANTWGAELFVSIHCNAFTNPQANGTETLCYPNSKNGRLLADCLQKRMIQAFDLTDRGIKERTDLYVLKHTAMPASLAEMAFISNEREEKILRDGTQAWARALYEGIVDYVKTREFY